MNCYNLGNALWSDALVKPVGCSTTSGFNFMPHKGYKQTEEHKKKLSNLNRGKTLSEEHKQKICGENNGNWIGNNIGYDGLHKWVVRWLGNPDTCEHCKESGFLGRKIQWANKSHEYKRDISDWLRLCVRCHQKYDSDYRKSLARINK